MKGTAPQVWERGEKRAIGARHLLILLGLILIGALVGAFGSISFPLGFGVNFFWTGISVQQVGSIWFGGWGVLAGVLFPFLSNAIAGTPFYISAAYIPANLVQSFLPAWAFRRFKADPAIGSSRDAAILLMAMVVSNAFGAIWSPLVVLRGFGLLNTQSAALFIWAWFAGNMVAGLVFNFILLRALSGSITRMRIFVRGWWA